MLPERPQMHLHLVVDQADVDEALHMAQCFAAQIAQMIGHRWDRFGLPDETIGSALVPMVEGCRRWLSEAASRATAS